MMDSSEDCYPKTFEALARELADHVGIQCFMFASNACPSLTPTRGFLVSGPSGSGRSTLIKQTIDQIKEFQPISTCNISAIEGILFYNDDDNCTKSYIKSVFRTVCQSKPTVLLLDDLDDIYAFDAFELPRSLFISDLATFFQSLNLDQPVAIIAASSQSSNPNPSLFKYTLPTPASTESLRFEILQDMLEPLIDQVQFDLDVVESINQISHDPVVQFANYLALLTTGYTPKDLSHVIRHLLLLALTETHDTKPKINANMVTDTLSSVLPSLSVSMEYTRQTQNVNWSGIAGYDQTIAQLKAAVIQPLRYPQAYVRLGTKPPGGVLLYGPPGCGKSMLAHALKSEPGVNMISIKGPELLSKYFGESESRIRSVFKEARQAAPSILFFEDMDIIGVKRQWSSSASHLSVSERVLSTLLNEMDGVSSSQGVLVLGCTNQPSHIDDALLRPGRLDQLIYVPLPTANDRHLILQHIKCDFADNVDLLALANAAVGFSGAQVLVLVREAMLLALESDCLHVQLEHVAQAACEMGVPFPSNIVSPQNQIAISDDGDGEWSDDKKLEEIQSKHEPRRFDLQRMALLKREEQILAPYLQFMNRQPRIK